MIPTPHPSSWHTAVAAVLDGDTGALTRLAMARGGELRGARQVPGARQPYGRRVLLADDVGEVMLASWRHGATCAPHDHGDARGLVVVLDGRFTETLYSASPAGLRTGPRRTHGPGDVLRVERGVVHDMHAHGAGTTLHVYVPGIHAMRVHDREARATLLVAGDCGAWVPDDPAQVLARWAWSVPGDASVRADAPR